MTTGPMHQNKKWLESQYAKTKNIYTMADIAGCHPRTIHKWMAKHNIKMNGMKGRKHTEETKEKISKGVLATCLLYTSKPLPFHLSTGNSSRFFSILSCR